MAETLTVTQLNNKAKELLKKSPDVTDVWVTGEISNLKKYSSGHYYFTLKDAGSQVSGVLFAGARSRMSFEPKENMKVNAFGSLDIYVQRGSYQFIVATMRQTGIGDLYQAFEELKAKLKAEGLFDQERKRPLPRYPRTIGVVTSETGAVIHDIITTSSSRFPADILLAPAQVQGAGAAETIVAGIRLLNKVGVDVIIVGRGGGSLEDLWPFNEEIVARAIAASGIPIVSAVGHETDFTIADFVADARAPTPTGAAAIILRERTEIRDQLNRDMANASRALSSVIERMESRFRVLDAQLSPEKAMREMDMQSMSLDDLMSRAERALNDQISDMRRRFEVAEARISPNAALGRLEALDARLDAVYGRLSPQSALTDLEMRSSRVDYAFNSISSESRSVLASAEASLRAADGRLTSLNPTRVMERGYGILMGPDGRAVTSVSGLLVGERVDIRLRDGTAKATVREIREEKR
ncbi:MAG: exodeoxyribonuclease VII large subunit [Thermoplasmata archaeon]|nr:exodeoxyribonuclease VII large subunit [Thermoplasmata archaeon]